MYMEDIALYLEEELLSAEHYVSLASKFENGHG